MNFEITKTSREVSKDLENISFNALKITQLNDRKDDHITVIKKANSKSCLKINKISPESKKTKHEPKTQFEAFQNAMKLLFKIGQSIGLNSAQGICSTIITNIRFTIYSWRFFYCLAIGISQSIAFALCFYRLLKNPISINSLGFFSFYGATCTTTYMFIQIGHKWPKLMKELTKCGLDEYVDQKLRNKCYIATVVIIGFSIIEHLMAMLYKIESIVSCRPNSNVYEQFLLVQFPWYFELNVPINIPFGIYCQVINILSTLNWNYLDLYIICISMYLASLLNKLNAKIITASEKHYLPPSHWRVLREEYNRATRLVRSFDDVISGLTFTSFASNLFFICLQIFNIVAHGVNFRNNNYACQRQLNNGILSGYEYTVYLLFSTVFLLAKALTVSLVAASVNTTSLVPSQALYSVPSSAYCEEVSRFITQVNEDKVALSGLRFFYVTKDLVLTVAGTIVTYELVLLQFSSSNDGF